MNKVIYSDLKKKHILITGVAQGIGKSTAVGFLNQGSKVTGIDLDKGELNKLNNQFKNNNNIHLVCCDITKHYQIKDIIQVTEKKYGPIDVLVNNAGSNIRIKFEKTSYKTWKQHLTNNLDHMYHVSKLVLPNMKKIGNGSIINLSSTAWMKYAPNLTAYHAAKAGVIGLTCGMASDLGSYFIRVNAVAPGRVITKNEIINQNKINPDWEKETFKIQCIPKFVTPENIASTIIWLGSSQSELITGQTIVIDGGVVQN